jgi:hypothetical protein
MAENIENPGEHTDNTAKPEVVKRHPDSEILYVGCKDAVAVDLIKAALGEKFRIFVMNKDIFNKTSDNFVRAYSKHAEDEKILEYCKKPENMHEALKTAKRVEEKVGEGNWFTLKQFIDETSFTYKHARSTMEMLFAFGFVAQNVRTDQYMVVADPRIKLKYVEDIERDLISDLEKFKEIKRQIKDGIEEGLKAIEEVKESLRKSKDEGTEELSKSAPADETTEESKKIAETATAPVAEKPVKKRAPRKKKDTSTDTSSEAKTGE